MSLTLITDGMLRDCCISDAIPPNIPEGIHVQGGTAPVTPCAPIAYDPSTVPPETPAGTNAQSTLGGSGPSVPCAPTAYDPATVPPETPAGTSAQETSNSSAPAVPRCPQGYKE